MVDYSKAISFSELYKAFKECIRGISWKDSVKDFVADSVCNIYKLSEQLKNNTYRISPYVVFKLNTPKKDRLIYSTSLRDRIVQRSLCNNGLYELLSKSLIYDNGACLKEKGTQHTERRFEKFILDAYHSYNGECWSLKLDIHNYFGSIPHDKLKNICYRKVKDYGFRKHIKMVIDSFPDIIGRCKEDIQNDKFGVRGVGLGSQLSQLFALLYLDQLDHFIKEKLHVKWYIRYMDDVIMICGNKDVLLENYKIIQHKITNEFGLQLNENKMQIRKLTDRLTFMGVIYRFKNGKLLSRLNSKTIKREIHRLKKLCELLKCNEISIEDLMQHCNIWTSCSAHKANKKQIQKISNMLHYYVKENSVIC